MTAPAATATTIRADLLPALHAQSRSVQPEQPHQRAASRLWPQAPQPTRRPAVVAGMLMVPKTSQCTARGNDIDDDEPSPQARYPSCERSPPADGGSVGMRNNGLNRRKVRTCRLVLVASSGSPDRISSTEGAHQPVLSSDDTATTPEPTSHMSPVVASPLSLGTPSTRTDLRHGGLGSSERYAVHLSDTCSP